MRAAGKGLVCREATSQSWSGKVQVGRLNGSFVFLRRQQPNKKTASSDGR